MVDGLASSTCPWTEASESEEVFSALSLGLKDYLAKCGFKSAVLGLSGGIDSAVCACIAVDALGRENVLGVSMPTRFSSRGSIDDALALAGNLGIRCLEIPIQDAFDGFRNQFAELFRGLPEDTAEENMQPRLRGMVLMALSNKFGHLLLTTGNKSELAVGYCTFTETWQADWPSSVMFPRQWFTGWLPGLTVTARSSPEPLLRNPRAPS